MQNLIEDGVYVASLTPLKKNLKCDHSLLAEHCFDLLRRGCKGVVLFGTTGEGASFSTKEKITITKKVISKGLNPAKMILGNGSSSLQDTIELAKASLENNCLANLIAPPCFYKKVSEEGVIAYYREIIKSVSDTRLKVILYHIPQYTGVPLTPNIVKTLFKEFPDNVIGLKESEGNLQLVKELKRLVPECKIFVGKENQIPEALSYGASGSICGMANLWPELITSIYNTKNVAGLDEIEQTLQSKPFISYCKSVLAKSKHPNWKYVRPPLVPY